MGDYYAHVRGDGTVQSVQKHLDNVAGSCKDSLVSCNLPATGCLLGELHDIGKFKKEFQDYLFHGGVRGDVKHSYAGARLLLELFHKSGGSLEALVSEVLSAVLLQHHGLRDFNREGVSLLDLQKNIDDRGYSEVLAQVDLQRVKDLFDASMAEMKPLLLLCAKTGDVSSDYDRTTSFCIGILSRMLCSVLVDSDWSDTSFFMSGESFSGANPNWSVMVDCFESKYALFKNDTDITRARSNISEACLSHVRDGGLFRCCVDTGGGKTLAMLRFCLHLCKTKHKDRIVMVSPYLSITDQTARVVRDCMPDGDIVLEHHSNVCFSDFVSGEDVHRYAKLCERWDVPIVVTTMVQFLNVLFSNDLGCVRRLRSLMNSVVVLDEIQSLPSNLIGPVLITLSFLSKAFGIDVVFCSATQPPYDLVPVCGPLYRPVDIAPDRKVFREVFHRTDISYAGRGDTHGIANAAVSMCHERGSVLVVCNTKKSAARLFDEVRRQCAGSVQVFHLSAAMCQAHRKLVLEEVCDCIRSRTPVICVSTQVVEAGVDVSFASGIRCAAGLINIIQMAGRVCRSNEYGFMGKVIVFDNIDEDLSRLPEMTAEKSAFLTFYSKYAKNPALFGDRLDTNESIRAYYEILYGGRSNDSFFNYYRESGCTMFDLLSQDSRHLHKTPGYDLWNGFSTAGFLFRAFDSNSRSVICDFGNGENLKALMFGKKALDNAGYMAKLVRQAQPYCVSLHESTFQLLLRDGSVFEIHDGVYGMTGNYDSCKGFVEGFSSDNVCMI